MRVQIFHSSAGWYVRLVGANGEKLTISEPYVTKWNAKRAAKRVFPLLEIEYA